jgi:hypothetical protein
MLIILQYANLEMDDEAKKLVVIFVFDGSKGQMMNVFCAPPESNQPAFIDEISGATRWFQMGNCSFHLEVCPLKFLLGSSCPLKLYFFKIAYLFFNDIVIVFFPPVRIPDALSM